MAIVPKSGITIPRMSVVGSEGLWTKMFDPVTESPPTPERLDLTLIGLDGHPVDILGNPSTTLPVGLRANPVPSVMAAVLPPGLPNPLGLPYLTPATPYTVTRSLMHGMTIPTWDGGGKGGNLTFFLFADDDLQGKDAANKNFKDGQFPAPTYRAPRGVIVHNSTAAQGPPPHTIHWHGIEPTPMNDGVGHCSMELGQYTYQWQPNFIGTYFYHCHRNTMQHFEFGLAGLMLFNPPDAFFASIDPASVTAASRATGVISLLTNPDGTLVIPIGHGRPELATESDAGAAPQGRFRTAANLNFSGLPFFPGFVGGDPVQGVATLDPRANDSTLDPFLRFRYDPHAFTIPYDVECLWAVDDRDSVWSDNAQSAFATFPSFGSIPGVNDQFNRNPGSNGFFNFNDFNADYWFVTGVPVPAVKGGSASIPTGLVIPPQLNSGVSGSRIDIEAGLGQTVFVRCLCSSYNSVRTTFPLDVVIIEWDGRALGVPPLNRYTRPILVPKNTPIVTSTARRWGAILRSTVPVNDPVQVEFLDTRSGEGLSLTGGGDVLMTALIPCHIN